MAESFDWRCPRCGCQEFSVLVGRIGPWSMEPNCGKCGFIGEDRHFIAVEKRENEAAKEKAA